MEINGEMIKLSEPTQEIHVVGKDIQRVNQDKLGRVYIWLK